MPMINIKDLSFGYDGSDKMLFDDITISLDTTWKLALAGRNGRGKTTFFKLLRGELDHAGTITGVPPTVLFPMDELPDCEEWKVRKELNLMGADPDIMWRPMDTLSGGERTKLMLAYLFAGDGIYPLIDEPTNHLDRQGREAVASYLASKEGFILISHDRAFLDRCTDHTLVITKSGVELVGTTFSTWWENNEQRQESELARNNQLKKEMGSIEAAMKKNAQWSSKAESYKNRANAPSKVAQNHWTRAYEGSKAKKLMSLSKNLEQRNEKKLEEKQSLLKDLEREQTLKIFGSTHHDKTPVMLKDVTVLRDGEVVASGINLTVGQGQKISLQGTNGCGKSTLIKFLTGDEALMNEGGSSITATGDIHIAKGLKISYVGQDTSVLKGCLYDIADDRGCDKTQFSTILVKMGFTKEMLYRDVDALSLGQKKFVMLALSLCERADVYLWDEPLNYIDVYMRKEIERLVKSSDVTMLFVEHDKAFVENVADECFEFG
ncbi:MAG: ABC-F family ATP-binding cassette domain-containing protein [Clostridiales bacterium]|nr:ABC-F family ATP-binding cassette domain-containing protein [Clostridiales bacterium]